MEDTTRQDSEPTEDRAEEASNSQTAPLILEEPQADQETVPEEPDQEHLREMLQRVQADFVNYRRRSEEEREEHQKYANSRLILKLIPVLDDFNLAIDHAAGSEADPSWLEGIRLIHRNMQTLLESESVTKIQVDGKEFDPFEHEAIGSQESSEHREGHIVSVVREGYKLGGRIIRPAMVIVAKARDAGPVEPAAPEPSGSSEPSCSKKKETDHA